MRAILSATILILAFATFARAVDAPEYDRLRANYLGAVERATRPLTQAYLIELEKQCDLYARASKLEAANAVQK